MFNRAEMRKIARKARNDELNSWKKLREEIRYRAYHGYDYYLLYRVSDYNLIHTLREFGFNVEFNNDEDTWCVRWD